MNAEGFSGPSKRSRRKRVWTIPPYLYASQPQKRLRNSSGGKGGGPERYRGETQGLQAAAAGIVKKVGPHFRPPQEPKKSKVQDRCIDALWDLDVCPANGLQAPDKQGDDHPPAVDREPAGCFPPRINRDAAPGHPVPFAGKKKMWKRSKASTSIC